MANNDIGGFLIKLGIDTDKNSFESAVKGVDQLTNKFNRLIGVAKNAAVVTSVLKINDMASASYKTAQALGIATEKLNTWKAAANIAGVNANGLVSSMSQLASVMNHLDINGKGLQGYSTQLGELGLGVDSFKGMSPDEAYAKIISTAQSKALGASDEEKLRLTTIIGDILGDAGQQFYIELQRTGTSVGEFLSGASRTQIVDEKDIQKGSDFAREARTLGEELKSISQKLGIEAGGAVTPYLEQINNWIQQNGDTIELWIEKIARGIGIVTERILKFGKWLFSDDSEDHAKMAKLLGESGQTSMEYAMNGPVSPEIFYSLLMNGASDEEQKQYQKELDTIQKVQSLIKTDKKGKKLNKKETSAELYDALVQYAILGGDLNALPLSDDTKNWINDNRQVKEKRMNDGILRPNGQITQVAPDDWVFAARNIGDLASAFIPQNYGVTTNMNAPSSYIINQTFNVNGNGNIGALVRQQAYNGTRDGLMSAMTQSSQRVQLMSGTL